MTISSLRPTLARLAEPQDAPERYYVADGEHQLVADPSRRQRVAFASDELRLAGHIYRPSQADKAERTPAIVMCGPSSSIKEQTLPHYAERFADAGYAVLTFDPRTYGESEGEPRATTTRRRSSPTTPTRSVTYSLARTSTKSGSPSSGCAWAAGMPYRRRRATSGFAPWRVSAVASTSAGRSSPAWAPTGSPGSCGRSTSS